MNITRKARLTLVLAASVTLALSGCSLSISSEPTDQPTKKTRGGPGFELVLSDGTPCKGVDRPGPGDQDLSCGWHAPRQTPTKDTHGVRLVTYNDGIKCAVLDDAITCDWPTT